MPLSTLSAVPLNDAGPAARTRLRSATQRPLVDWRRDQACQTESTWLATRRRGRRASPGRGLRLLQLAAGQEGARLGEGVHGRLQGRWEEDTHRRGRGVREGGVVTRPVGPSAAAVAVHGERRACVAEAGRAHRCQLVRSSPRWRQRPWRWTSPPPAWPGAPPWPWPAAWGASVGGGQRNGWAAAGNRLRKAGWPGGAAVPRPAAGTHSSSSSSGSSASAGRAASSAGRASSVAATQRRLLPTSAAAWLLARHGPFRRPWRRTVDAHGLADRAEKEAIGAALCGHRRVTSSNSTSFELSLLDIRHVGLHSLQYDGWRLLGRPQCRRPAVAPAPQGLAPRPAS